MRLYTFKTVFDHSEYLHTLMYLVICSERLWDFKTSIKYDSFHEKDKILKIKAMFVHETSKVGVRSLWASLSNVYPLRFGASDIIRSFVQSANHRKFRAASRILLIWRQNFRSRTREGGAVETATGVLL